MCPKCDRGFVRGDALARHSKGGCATSRKDDIGSFGGDEDMDGVMYTNEVPQTEFEMTEEERGRFNLPSIKAQHGGNLGSTDYEAHARAPSIYPPDGSKRGRDDDDIEGFTSEAWSDREEAKTNRLNKTVCEKHRRARTKVSTPFNL